MNNWSVDEKKLKKNSRAFAIWKIEQMANFGLGDEKIRASDYRAYANTISIHDSWRKKYLDLLVYGEKNLK